MSGLVDPKREKDIESNRPISPQPIHPKQQELDRPQIDQVPTGATMKAVRIHAYGAADVLTYEDAPRPHPVEGEVLIRVYATTVNPFDCAVRAGYMSAYFNHRLPLILGTGCVGYHRGGGTRGREFHPWRQRVCPRRSDTRWCVR